MIIKRRSPRMRHVSRTHRVPLDWLFDRIHLDSEIQIKCVDTKTQLADLLAKRSFTRDEWCNLLRLFNIMNFSMFFRCHLRSHEKASTMSKRIQERKTGEEVAVAKPMSICLISRNLSRQKQPSSFGSDASNVPVNPQLDSESVSGSCGNLQRNSHQNPATFSQERNEDTMRQGSYGKLQRGVENQVDKTRLDYHNMRISDHVYVGKVFENLREHLSLSSYTLDAKTNILISWLFMSTTMKSSVRLGLQYQENLVAHKKTQLRGAQHVLRFYVEIDRRTIRRDSECIHDDVHFLDLDEICPVSCSNDQVGESKKCMSTQIRLCVWEICVVIQNRRKSGKVRSKNFDNQTSTQSCLESIENHLCSSGIFSQDSGRLKCSDKFRKI